MPSAKLSLWESAGEGAGSAEAGCTLAKEESTVSEIKLTVPDETLLALKGTSQSVAAEVRLAAAVKLYEVGRLSSGAAATLAGRQSGFPIRDWAA
jgi:hypothetical protein